MPVPAAAVHPDLAGRDLVQSPAQLVQRHVAGSHEMRLRPLEPAPAPWTSGAMSVRSAAVTRGPATPDGSGRVTGGGLDETKSIPLMTVSEQMIPFGHIPATRTVTCVP